MTQTSLSRIVRLLDAASVLADRKAAGESKSTDPFTHLAQQIDYALAVAENMEDEEHADNIPF